MPKAFKDGESYTKVLPGSAGVGKVARGGNQVKAKTKSSPGGMSVDYRGIPDSRPSDNDRTQSAKS
jgi:hypothetical protein